MYATVLADDLVLAAVYDPYTPMTRIRSQINLVSRALLVPPAPGEPAAAPKTDKPSSQVILEPQPVTTPPAAVIDVIKTQVQATAPQVVMLEPAVAAQPPEPIHENPPPEAVKSPVDQPAGVAAPAQDPGWFEILARPEATSSDEEDDSPLDEASQISLAEMLASMPSPDPEVNRRTILPDWAAEGEQPAFIPAPTAFAATNPAELVETRTEEKIKIPNSMPVFSDAPSHLARFEGADLEQVQSDSLADTRPMLLGQVTQLSDMEPISAAYSRLSYTCLLVPRMPYHYLTGDLADRLNQWLTHCCLAFGWRLEGMAIRPEYMQWIVQVSPAISPGNLVRIVRQRTSQYIFSHYPQLNYENPSGDFWAPGYMILSGSQLPSTQMLREFIAQTRQRQGIKRS